MNESQLVRQIVNLLSNLGKRLYRFAQRKTIPLIGSAVVVLIIWQSWRTYDEFRSQELTFLTGSLTGPSMDDARRIKEELEADADSLTGKAYNLSLSATSGYEENRRRIEEDESGKFAGFAYDGFGESKNTAIVLPLDKRYLHILCRKEFLRGLTVESDSPDSGPAQATAETKQPIPLRDIPLSQIYSELKKKPGRVYLGTPGSATRQCADIVLKHFGVDPDKARCHGVGGFDEIRSAFARQHIDMAFSSGNFSSKIIREIARDGHCVLLGLNDERDAIVQENPFLLSVDFQPNSYVSGDFCPTIQQTVGARRVVICSDVMSAEDAYLLGISTVKGLRDKMPEIEWETSPPGAEKFTPAPLRYRLHPGAKLIRNEQLPSGNYRWLEIFLATIAVWAAAEMVRWLNSLFEAQPDKPEAQPDKPEEQPVTPADDSLATGTATGTATAPTDAYSALKAELDEQIAALERTPLPLTRNAYTEWGKTIRDLRERTLEANRAGSLTPQQTHTVLTGLHQELTLEREIRKPASRQKSGKVEKA